MLGLVSRQQIKIAKNEKQLGIRSQIARICGIDQGQLISECFLIP